MSLADDPHKDLLREAGWHTRGYLPHFDGRATPQTITLHLADAVPAKVIERWQRQLRYLKDEEQLKVMQDRIDKYLDQGYGECLLRDPCLAEMVQSSLLKYDSVRYQLFAWCVMPNHEHSLMTRLESCELEEIIAILGPAEAQHEVEQALPIDHDDAEDRADLDRDGEELGSRAEPMFRDEQMAGARDR